MGSLSVSFHNDDDPFADVSKSVGFCLAEIGDSNVCVWRDGERGIRIRGKVQHIHKERKEKKEVTSVCVCFV